MSGIPESNGNKSPAPLWPCVVLGGVMLLVSLLSIAARPATIAWDFHQFYVAGKIEARQLYNGRAQEQMDYELWRQHFESLRPFSFAPFLKPAFYRLALVPLVKLPFWRAYAVWATVQLLCFVAAVALLARRYGYHSSWYVPLGICPYVVTSIIWAQDTALVFLLVVLAFDLLLRGRDASAGAILALGLVKYNVLMLLPLAPLLHKRWRMVGAFTAVAAIEIALSAWVIPGPTGIRDYLSLLRSEYGSYWDLQMPCLRGFALFLGLPNWIAMLLVVAAGLLCFRLVSRLEMEKAFPVAAACSVFLSYHAMGYDLMFLLLPLISLSRPANYWKSAATVLFISPASLKMGHWATMGVFLVGMACILVTASGAGKNLSLGPRRWRVLAAGQDPAG